NLDVRAHSHHFQRVHKTVFEDVFDDDRRPLGLGRQRHVLRLHIGGEAGILSVTTSAALMGLSPITRTESAVWRVLTPTSASFSSKAPKWVGSQPATFRSP